MRWPLGREPGACTTCGAAHAAGARWCGACGAPVAPPTVEEEAPVDVAVPDEEVPPPPASRRWAAAAVVAVLVGALVAAAVLRTPTPVPLLGDVGTSTGVTATGPPSGTLRLAWSHDLPGNDGMHGWWAPNRRLVEGDGLLRIDHRVVDMGTGALRAVAPYPAQSGARHRAELVEGHLVRIDTLTGEVAELGSVDASLLDQQAGVVLHMDGRTVLWTDDERLALVADDGRVVASLEGELREYVDRVDPAGPVLPLRRWRPDDEGDASAALTLVSVEDGTELATYPSTGAQVVDVVGDRVLVARNEDVVWLESANREVTWDVELLDGRTGAVVEELTLVASEPPRLLGELDGRPVLALRRGNEVHVVGLENGDVDGIAAVAPPSVLFQQGFGFEGIAPRVAAVVDDRLLLLGTEGLRAVDAASTVLWEVPVEGDVEMVPGQEHVALVPIGAAAATRVLVAADGEEVTRVAWVEPSHGGQGGPAMPALVLDDHVALGWRTGPGGLEEPLASTTWLRLRDGERTPVGDLLEQYMPEGEPVSGAWTLLGTERLPDGTVRPVLSRNLGSQQLEVVDAQGEVVRVLGLGPDNDEPFDGYAQVVGVSPTHVAAYSERYSSHGMHEVGPTITTHLIDRTTGGVESLDGRLALLLAGDVLVAGRMAPDWGFEDIVATSTSTGEQLWERAVGVDPYGLFGWRNVHDDELWVRATTVGVRAVGFADGEDAWHHLAARELLEMVVVLGEDHVVVATTHGEVVALDRDSGEVAWTVDVGSPVANLAGAGRDVLVGTVDGIVVHLRGDGREVQRRSVGAAPVTALAALGETVVAVSGNAVVGLRTDANGIRPQDEVDLP